MKTASSDKTKPPIDEEKRISNLIADNQPVNLRFYVLFLTAGTFGLTTALSQPNFIILLNCMSIILTISSLAIKNNPLIQSLIIFIEMARGPAILCLGCENYLFWTTYSFQFLLIMFSERASVAFAQLSISLLLHYFISPEKFFSNVLNPLISPITTESQEKSLIFIYSLLYSGLIWSYVHRNQKIDKLWAALTEIKDKEIASLKKTVAELKKENNQLSETMKARGKDTSHYLWMLTAYTQLAYEDAGSKIRDTIQKIDSYAQLLTQQLIYGESQSISSPDSDIHALPVTRTTVFVEKIWGILCSLIADNSIKGQMKLSKTIPKKLHVNAQKIQAIILNVLIFLKQATQSARFKINIEWDELFVNRGDSFQLLPQRSQAHMSIDSWKATDFSRFRATEIVPASDYIILDNNQRLIRRKDLADEDGASEGRGMLRVRITIRSSEELSTFIEQYFGNRLPREEGRRQQGLMQKISQWEKIAESSLKPVVSLTKDSSNLLVRQKKRGTVRLEFYESAELVKMMTDQDTPAVQGESSRNRWPSAGQKRFDDQEKFQSPGMQRSFANVYNIGLYPRLNRKKVLIVDASVWGQKFFEVFFKKYDYSAVIISNLDELLETIKVEYDTLDLIVINDWIGDQRAMKYAIDVFSFLRIVGHGPIRTIIISETHSAEQRKLSSGYNDIKLIKAPVDLKELRESVTEES